MNKYVSQFLYDYIFFINKDKKSPYHYGGYISVSPKEYEKDKENYIKNIADNIKTNLGNKNECLFIFELYNEKGNGHTFLVISEKTDKVTNFHIFDSMGDYETIKELREKYGFDYPYRLFDNIFKNYIGSSKLLWYKDYNPQKILGDYIKPEFKKMHDILLDHSNKFSTEVRAKKFDEMNIFQRHINSCNLWTMLFINILLDSDLVITDFWKKIEGTFKKLNENPEQSYIMIKGYYALITKKFLTDHKIDISLIDTFEKIKGVSLSEKQLSDKLKQIKKDVDDIRKLSIKDYRAINF